MALLFLLTTVLTKKGQVTMEKSMFYASINVNPVGGGGGVRARGGDLTNFKIF